MSNYIIGITAYYHDSSVCLFNGDRLIFACEEEKFSGIKHDNSFPKKSLKYILNKYKLSKNNIKCVCYYENPKLRLKRRKSYINSLIVIFKVWYNLRKISNKIHYTDHHMSHMTYSYISSNFKNATIVSIDGVGETQTLVIGKGQENNIVQLKEIEYPHSMGLFYSAMTSFLGFKPNEGEYKVMGLASYGNSNTYYDKIKTLLKYNNNSIVCDMNYFTWDKSNNIMFNYRLEKLLGVNARLKNDKITEVHKDIAAAVQRVYEDVFFDILKYAKELCEYDNLCLGGGCAYNGTANGKIIENGLFKKIWIPPAPSDAGSSIGSCLSYLKTFNNKLRLDNNAFLGPMYNKEEIFNVLIKYNNINFEYYSNRRLLRTVSKYLNSGLIVGWFQGRIEFGARALGNRSILANPTLPDIKDKINSVIKRREGFRPFAPMVCFDKQSKYFKSNEYIPYMNQVVKVKDEYINKLPAITHIDGTSRVQSVKSNYFIYNLLEQFEKISGFPILLNTSFNVKDKTMVLSPSDAIETFIDTEMDILVIGNYLIKKI